MCLRCLLLLEVLIVVNRMWFLRVVAECGCLLLFNVVVCAVCVFLFFCFFVFVCVVVCCVCCCCRGAVCVATCCSLFVVGALVFSLWCVLLAVCCFMVAGYCLFFVGK